MDNTLDLFKPITKDERQEIARQTWIKNKCCGTMEMPTGFGKTWTAFKCIQSVLTKYPHFRIIVVDSLFYAI